LIATQLLREMIFPTEVNLEDPPSVAKNGRAYLGIVSLYASLDGNAVTETPVLHDARPPEYEQKTSGISCAICMPALSLPEDASEPPSHLHNGLEDGH
jgi:hypothetical protein